MAELEFSPQCLSLIRPRPSSHPKALPLPTIDYVARRMPYNRRVLFYDFLCVDRLKASLSEVLVHFYPAVGRLVEEDDGKLSIHCNDEGVEFVETSLPNLSMEEFAKDNFQMSPIFSRLVRWESNTPDEIFRMPLFSAQVTHFSQGGAALGVAISHVLADGSSLWYFMKSWAECCRGVPLSVPPVHDRTALVIDEPCADLARLKFQHVPPASVKTRSQQDAIAQRVFRFSKDKIQNLKDEASTQTPHRLSTYQVLCAHIWQSVTRARSLQDTDTIYFASAANFGSKINPALPQGFFGNSVMWVMTQTTAGQLKADSLAETASRVQASVLDCNQRTVEGFLHWLELHGVDELLGKVKLDEFRMRVSSSPRFPAYKVDFGWGKPLAVRSARVEEAGKIVLFCTREEDGAMDASIALPTHVMHVLLKDPDFV